jgi:hypothetical protein
MHTWEQIYLLYMSDASFFWELFLISLEPFIRMHGRKFNHVQFFNNDWSIIWKQIVYGYRREAYMLLLGNINTETHDIFTLLKF